MAASSVESTEKAMQDFTGSDAEALVKEVIAGKVKAKQRNFSLRRPAQWRAPELSYDDIDFTRTIDGYGFFPDVKFHDSQDAQKKYLVDFWVIPEDGKLQGRRPNLQGTAEGGRKLDHHGASADPMVWIPASDTRVTWPPSAAGK